jgi:1-acyl-sn-glycerol-3-phosphate acyltransferase
VLWLCTAHASIARGFDHLRPDARTARLAHRARDDGHPGPVVIIAALFRVPQGPTSIYTRCVRLWARTINLSAGVRVRVHGADRLHNSHGAVFVANHVSWFDVFALASELSWCSFVAKTELRRIPVFGFAAGRSVSSSSTVRIETGVRVLQAGREGSAARSSIVVAPGTRGNDYHLRPFKKGPFVLAIARSRRSFRRSSTARAR